MLSALTVNRSKLVTLHLLLVDFPTDVLKKNPENKQKKQGTFNKASIIPQETKASPPAS